MRVKITKSKNATSLYIIKDIHQNNKRTTVIEKKLGTLDHLIATLNLSEEEVLVWANEQAKRLALMEKNKCQEIAITYATTPLPPTNHTLNCGYLYLKAVYYQLGLDEITTGLKNKTGLACDLNRIVEMLVYARIMAPNSSGSSVNWAKALLEPFDFTHQEIWRALNCLEVHSDDYLDLLTPALAGKAGTNCPLVYYDWSEFFLDAPKKLPHLASIAIDAFCSGSGMPLSFGINSHHALERSKTIARQFPKSSLLICSDTNLNASSHHEFHRFKGLFAKKSHLIIQPLAKQAPALKDWALNGADWKLHGRDECFDICQLDESSDLENIYYKEWHVEENGIRQRLIAGFSLKYRNFTMKRLSESEKSNPSQQQYDLKIKRNTHDNHALSDDDACFPGFFIAKATGSEDIATLLEVIDRRFEMESLSHLIKNGFKNPPGKHQSNCPAKPLLKAHFLVCIMALAIECELNHQPGLEGSGSHWKKALRTMNAITLKDLGYLPNFEANAVTDKFHQLGWMDFYKEIISPAQMRAMIESITKDGR